MNQKQVYCQESLQIQGICFSGAYIEDWINRKDRLEMKAIE